MTEYSEHWPEVPQAQYLVDFREGRATVLCESHMTALRTACEAAGQQLTVYEMDPEEDPIVCQACHLVSVQTPRIVLPH